MSNTPYGSDNLSQELPSQSLCRVFKWSLLLLFILFMLAAPVAFSQDLKATISFTDSAYRIGPGDVLSFNVYHQEDFNQNNILVRSDGMASFNGVGELPVSGKSVAEVQRMLESEIGELVKNPIVTLSISQTKPGTIYLSGAVKHPGMYQLSTGNQNSTNGSNDNNPIHRIDLRLSNILSNAGGVNMDADLGQIQVTRRNPHGEMTMSVDLWKMLKDGDSSQDVMLQSGDSIYIPQLPKMAMNDEEYDLVLNSSIGPESFPVRVIGDLNSPGIYYLPGNSPYLNSAIAMAGGYKSSASQNMVAIRRFTNEVDVSTLYVDPRKTDIVLRPNDIVYISEKKMHKAGKFFEQVNKILAPFTNAAFSAAVVGGF